MITYMYTYIHNNNISNINNINCSNDMISNEVFARKVSFQVLFRCSLFL